MCYSMIRTRPSAHWLQKRPRFSASGRARSERNLEASTVRNRVFWASFATGFRV